VSFGTPVIEQAIRHVSQVDADDGERISEIEIKTF
jgi:hypothetical protein